jgi:hypothetical protein
MSTTIAFITTTRTIGSIRAKYIELGLLYKAKSIKKVRKRSIKKGKRGSIKNVRKGDATVIASGSNALNISY